MKDKPWVLLDISGKKLPSKMEGQDVHYLSLPTGTTLLSDWKNLASFLETRSGYDQVVSGWMTSVNTVGRAANKVANWIRRST